MALLSSLMAVSRVVSGAPAGWMAERWGWPLYFVICTLIGVPGLLLLLRYKHWNIKANP
jgi:PAT family beta-lactamase induction signal transducer AmpG